MSIVFVQIIGKVTKNLFLPISTFRAKLKPILLKVIIVESGIIWLALREGANATQRLSI